MEMIGQFSLQHLIPIAVAFVVIAFTVSMGAEILNDLYSDQTTNSYAQNATKSGLESLSELGSWLPTLALVVIAAVIIGVLITYLARGGAGV